MPSRGEEKYVLYPVYFNQQAPRGLRRVPQELAVKSPSAEQVAKACSQLRLQATIEKTKHHPARWNEKEGRVLIPVRGSKAVLLRQVGEELAKIKQDA